MPDYLGFLISQVTHIESEVYETQYPDIQYQRIVPVDTSPPEWIRSVTHFSMDQVGQARFLANSGTDMAFADVSRQQHNVNVESAGIGYGYTMDELEQAQMIPGRMLTSDKAAAARRAAEEFIDDLVLNGAEDMSWDGLLNNSNVTKADASATGTSNSRRWADKTGMQIISDVDSLLAGLWTNSRTVELADTLLLPPSAWSLLASHPRSEHSDVSLMEYIRQNNIYTAQTGRPLMMQVLRGLENAAASNTGRAIAYRRDPQVLRFYLPMPHKFLDPQQWMLRFVVPGIFRVGGLEIRRPNAVRYLDEITA